MWPVQVSQFPAWYYRLSPECRPPARYYDALIPASAPKGGMPFALEPHRRLALWVDVEVPRTARAGRYAGTLRLTAAGHDAAELAVRLEVFDFVLPDTSPADGHRGLRPQRAVPVLPPARGPALRAGLAGPRRPVGPSGPGAAAAVHAAGARSSAGPGGPPAGPDLSRRHRRGGPHRLGRLRRRAEALPRRHGLRRPHRLSGLAGAAGRRMARSAAPRRGGLADLPRYRQPDPPPDG